MNIEDFFYQLPEHLIAKYPIKNRSESRLFILDRSSQQFAHKKFVDLLDFINPPDLIIFNNTRVLPARLFAYKNSGGKVEILIERILDERHALAHIKKSRSLKIGMQLSLINQMRVEIMERCDSLFKVKFHGEQKLVDILHQIGEMPIPGYLKRNVTELDKNRYQTVYAQNEGGVAAPTAGLHFDETLIGKIKTKAAIGFVTLHVGAGTFKPIKVQNILHHQMHSEQIEVSEEICEKVIACKKNGGRIIAVGTTVMRSLETAMQNNVIKPFKGETSIFIYPGYQFKCVDMLLTNFHFPKSTLLILVSAFAGREKILQAYQEAINNNYRFYSYGDAMLII